MHVPRPVPLRRSPFVGAVAVLLAALLAAPLLLAAPASAAGSGVLNVQITPVNLVTGNPITEIGAGFAGGQVSYRVSYSCGTAACEGTQIAFSPSAPAPGNPVQTMPAESLLRYQSFVQPPSGGVTMSGDDLTGRVFTLGDLAPGTSANFSVTYAYATVRNGEIAPGAWFTDGTPIPMTATITSATATGPETSTAEVTWRRTTPTGPQLAIAGGGTVKPGTSVDLTFGMNPGNMTSSNGIVQGSATLTPAGSYQVVAQLPAEATITAADFGGVIDHVAKTVTWTAGSPGNPSYAARGGWSTIGGQPGAVGANNGLVPGGDAFWQRRTVTVTFPASAFPEADGSGCNFSKDVTTSADVTVSYLDAAQTLRSAAQTASTRVACATPFGGMPTPTKSVTNSGNTTSAGDGLVDTMGPGAADDVYAVNVPAPGEADTGNREWRVAVIHTGNVEATAVIDEPNLDQDHIKVDRITVYPYAGAPSSWAGTVEWVNNLGASGTAPVSATQAFTAPPGTWLVSARTTLPIAAARVLRTDTTQLIAQVGHRFRVDDGAVALLGQRRTNTADVTISYPADADGDGTPDDYTDTNGDPLPSRSFATSVSRTVQYTEPLGNLSPTFTGITVEGGGQLFPGTNVAFTMRATTSNVWPGTSIRPQLVFVAPVGWQIVDGSAAITAPGTGWADPAPTGVVFSYATTSIGGVDREVVVATFPAAVPLSSTANEQWPTLTVLATPTNTAPVGVNTVAQVWAGDQSGTWTDVAATRFRQAADEFVTNVGVAADSSDVDGDGNTTEEYGTNVNADGLIVSATDSVSSIKELCVPDEAAADGCQWVSDPSTPGEVQSDAGDVTYRIRIVNSGNTTLREVVAYDVLPHIGDTGLLPGGAPRGSQFGLTLAGVDATSSGVAVAGSASTNPARPEVFPGAVGTVDDWDAPVAGDKALRITVAGDLAPAEERSVAFRATIAAGATPGQLACNSAAVDSEATLPAEPASVCVTLTAPPNPPPTVTIGSPSDGATYEYGESVTVVFACIDTDIASCVGVDEDGDPVVAGTPLDTTTPGPHTLSVTAFDSIGQTASETVSYTVEERPNDPPTATITGPEQDGVYFQGQEVPAAYTCADPDGTVVSCVGPVPDGADIDTATVGPKTFTVTATDDAGATGTATVTYRVVAVDGLCTGIALGVLGIDLGGANVRETPCATASSTVLDAGVHLGPSLPPLLRSLQAGVRAQALLGATQSGPGLASGTASVARVTIGIPSAGLALEVHGVHTSAVSRLSSCATPAALSSSSRVQRTTLNGRPILVGEGAPITVPLIIGALHLNQRIESGNTVVRRAVFLDLPGTALDVVVAESKAGVVCAP